MISNSTVPGTNVFISIYFRFWVLTDLKEPYKPATSVSYFWNIRKVIKPSKNRPTCILVDYDRAQRFYLATESLCTRQSLITSKRDSFMHSSAGTKVLSAQLPIYCYKLHCRSPGANCKRPICRIQISYTQLTLAYFNNGCSYECFRLTYSFW